MTPVGLLGTDAEGGGDMGHRVPKAPPDARAASKKSGVHPIAIDSDRNDEVTKVERSMHLTRLHARERCEPGLMSMLRDEGYAPHKLQAKMKAYSAVLDLLASGDLRASDLYAIKHDWDDALSSAGGWQRGS